MIKKTILACLAGTYLVTGIGYAAPVVDVSKGDILMNLSYNRLDTNIGDLRFTAPELTLTHGLSNKFALSTGVTFTNDENIPLLGPVELNVYDIKLQYKATRDLAPFIGFKKWEMDYEGSPADIELASQTGLQYGVIYNKKLAEKTSAFALISFGNDIKEYKLGLAYDISKDCSAEINYRKISLDTHGKDFDAKGVGIGFTYKF